MNFLNLTEKGDLIKRYWAVALCSILIEVIVVFRVIFSLRSGFVLPDEALYFGSYYPSRWFFHLVLDSVFYIFQIQNIYQFLVITPFFNSIFLIGCLLMVFKILKFINTSDSISNFVVLSMFLTVTFIVNVPFVLTEALSLFLVFLGIYGELRLFENNDWKFGIVAGSCFLGATLLREPYVLFGVGGALMTLIFLIERRKNILVKIPFIMIASTSLMLLPQVNFRLLEKVYVKEGLVPIGNVDRVLATLRTTFPQQLQLAITNYPIGVLLSWNLIFGAFAIIGTILLLKKWRNHNILEKLLTMNVLLAFLSFLGTTYVLSQYQFFVTPLCLSSMIRFSHTSLPAIFSLSVIYKKIDPRKIIILAVIFCLVLTPVYLFAVQSNLSTTYVNRFNWNYRSPWFRLTRHVEDSGKILVMCEPLVRAKLFAESENITIIFVPLSQVLFDNYINQDWDKVFLYGEKHILHYRVLNDTVPYYYRIVMERINVETVWDDGESYLLELIR